MRSLSTTFMDALTNGFLSPLRQRVVEDKDLDLQIRDNYLNIYFKGNSLLKLAEASASRYVPAIHAKFLDQPGIPDLVDDETTQHFLDRIPAIKEKIIRHGASALEVEYEQLLIRANNGEPRNNSEYFIVDRQLTLPRGDRIDLTAVFWERVRRRRGQEVPLCFLELKFALNADIQKVHSQLERYYQAVHNQSQNIAEEAETVFHQKLELGLFDQPRDRIEAMKTLRVTRDPDKFRFVLVLVDYNPFSKLLDLSHLSELPFADRLSVFYAGLAMWQSNLSALTRQQ